MKSDFNLGFLVVAGRQEEFLTPTIAGLLLCVPELGRSPGLYFFFLITVVKPSSQFSACGTRISVDVTCTHPGLAGLAGVWIRDVEPVVSTSL
jgi:hypothetical protein